MKKVFKAFNKAGADATVSADGESVKLMYLGDDAGKRHKSVGLRKVAEKASLTGEHSA